MFFRKKVQTPDEKVIERANLFLNMEASEFNKHLEGGRVTLLDVYAVQYLEQILGTVKTPAKKPTKKAK